MLCLFCGFPNRSLYDVICYIYFVVSRADPFMMRAMLKAMLPMLYLWSLQEGGQTKPFRVLWQVSNVIATIYLERKFHDFHKEHNTCSCIRLIFHMNKSYIFSHLCCRAFSSWSVAAVIRIKLMIYVYICLFVWCLCIWCQTFWATSLPLARIVLI